MELLYCDQMKSPGKIRCRPYMQASGYHHNTMFGGDYCFLIIAVLSVKNSAEQFARRPQILVSRVNTAIDAIDRTVNTRAHAVDAVEYQHLALLIFVVILMLL